MTNKIEAAKAELGRLGNSDRQAEMELEAQLAELEQEKAQKKNSGRVTVDDLVAAGAMLGYLLAGSGDDRAGPHVDKDDSTAITVEEVQM
eukprot:SAG22_NODE_6457_length_851_cov_1.698138_2_plen_89_part_01